jgi:hypothetical protein
MVVSARNHGYGTTGAIREAAANRVPEYTYKYLRKSSSKRNLHLAGGFAGHADDRVLQRWPSQRPVATPPAARQSASEDD